MFSTFLVQSLYCLYQKFQASSHLPWLHSPVCARPGWKPRGQVFHDAAQFHLTENSAHNMTAEERLSGELKPGTPAGSALGLDWTADLQLKGAHEKVPLILPFMFLTNM